MTLVCGVGVYYFASESLKTEVESLSIGSAEPLKAKPFDKTPLKHINKPVLSLSERREQLYKVQENAAKKGFESKAFECDSYATQGRIIMSYSKNDFEDIDGILLLKEVSYILNENYSLSFVTIKKSNKLESIISFQLIQ